MLSTKGTQCSANYITSSAVDVYFQTGGQSGEVICYAFRLPNANRFKTPTDMSLVQSKAYVVVYEEYKNYDHQLTLKNLRPSVEYNVYFAVWVSRECTAVEQPLDIKTTADAKISSVSMAVNDKNSQNIKSIRLSFRVGADLSTSDTINVTFYKHQPFRTADIVSPHSGCTITSTDRSQTTAAYFSVPTTKTLVATLTQGCIAGSRVTIECDSRNLAANSNSNGAESQVNFLIEIGQGSSGITQKLYHQFGYVIQT